MIESCPPQVNTLVRRLQDAVTADDIPSICDAVKNVLSEELGQHRVDVPEKFLQTSPDGYARHCLFRDPEGRFTVVVMVWAAGQGTPLHDHAGSWCVECVYEGRIRVTSYDLEADQTERVKFHRVDTVEAGVGGAGALIPPYEYHTLENPFDATAVTIHVYQGELTWCNAFHPTEVEGWYTRERRVLQYS